MNPIEFIKEHMGINTAPQPTRNEISVGSPNGMLILAPRREQPRQAVANRKNRRFAAKIKRGLMTEARISARLKKERKDARSKD